jgi:galactokinase
VLLCQRAEHEYAFVPCGVMDQFTAVAAREDHVVLLDCRSLEPRLIPWADPSVVVLIVNSNVKHDLGKTNEYALRRQQCQEGARILGVELLRDITVAEVDASTDRLGPVLARRVGHVVRENARTLSAAETIARGNWRQLGQLLYESHVSLRDDFEVSCPELDVLVELAQAAGEANGIYGGRMTGGGFGGSTVNLVRADAVESLTGYFETEYRARVGIAPTVFATRPTGGARVVQAP